jgi:hypothetical protein
MKFLTNEVLNRRNLPFLSHNSEVHANDNLRVRRLEESPTSAPTEGAVILEVTLNDPPVSAKDSRSSNSTAPFEEITMHIYKESAAHEEDNGKVPLSRLLYAGSQMMNPNL